MDPLDLVGEMGRLFEEVGIAWVLGGSMASSVSGQPRATMDVDMAVRMELEQVAKLCDVVTPAYYASEHMIRDAVVHRSSFNIIRLDGVMRVDVFVLGDGLLDQRQMDRRRQIDVPGTAGPIFIWVGSPEDQVLRKLHWFQLGGEVSDRQWNDVLGLLTVQAATIDFTDVVYTATQLGLGDLAVRAIADAGLG
jgi:hypothetical protein